MTTTPFLEALSSLTDRALRRLLGARAFLRGTDYVRRGAVADVVLGELSARGLVRGSDPEPYRVELQVTPTGFRSECSCPVFGKLGGHCKHVGALLVALRDQYRPKQAEPAETPAEPSRFGGRPSLPPLPRARANADGAAPAPLRPFVDDGFDEGGKGLGRRARRRAARAAAFSGAPAAPPVVSGRPSVVPTSVEAWLPEPLPPIPKKLEFRMQVKPTGLLVSILDPDTRTYRTPGSFIPLLAQNPSTIRDAIRLLARLDDATPGSRKGPLEVRGEDAADLLAALKGQRVVLEPQLMELRFGDEPLRPGFDLELTPEGDRVQVRAAFLRAGDPRRFSLAQGAWFEGSPGYYVDPQEGVARPIDKRVSPSVLKRLKMAPFIHEPLDRLPALIAQGLPRIALEMGADLPELSQVADVVDLEPTFRLRAGGTLTEARASLRAAYGETEVEVRGDGMSIPVIVTAPERRGGKDSKRARCIRCDIAGQQVAANLLRNLGLAFDEESGEFIVRGDDAIQFWSEGIGQLPETWDLYAPDDLVDVQMRGQSLVANARVSSGVDWLSLRLNFESEGIAVTSDELARCLSEGRRYVRLSDGSFAPIDVAKVRAVLQRQAEILATSGAVGGKLPLSQAGRLEELLGQVGKSAIDAGAKALFAKLRDVDEIKGAKKPRNLKAQLRPYQEAGFQWLSFLHEIGSGGILADDMGLGKTLQTITLLLSVKAADEKAGTPFKALIVAPTSVVTNWLREIAKFAPSLKAALWHGNQRKKTVDELEDADVILTSYAILRRDEELFSTLDLRYAILDEAQHIKNPHSATAKAAKRIRASRRLALSGTPIENRLAEIWSIFDFVSPGLLGPLEKFEERYARPIDAGDVKAAARLRQTIHPFILRRTKAEVAKDLPEKIEMDNICELAPEQANLYASVLKEVRAQVLGEVEQKGIGKSHLQILAGLTRLRQAACDPRLLGLPRTFEDDDSGKLAALRELVSVSIAGGHRMLVFSQFTSMLALIKAALDKDGVAYEYLDGSTKDRQARVENFQRDDGPPVFLISLKAGGSGLNLTAADTVVHFDPWWNPAVEDQATDRAHRIGQTKVVTTYRLVAKGTIEEKILELGGKKRELVGAVLSEDLGGAKKLTKGDLESLFAD